MGREAQSLRQRIDTVKHLPCVGVSFRLLGSIRPHMADDSFPNWDNYPNLDGLITQADIETKGGGKFVPVSFIGAESVSPGSMKSK